MHHNRICGSLFPKYERQTRLSLTHGPQQNQMEEDAHLPCRGNPCRWAKARKPSRTIPSSGLGPGWPLQALGQQQGLDVCLDLLHVVIEFIDPLVLPGFAGLDIGLQLRPHGSHLRSHGSHLRPEEASQPKNSRQRSAGLDPVCKHGWGNGHGVVLGARRLGGSQIRA